MDEPELKYSLLSSTLKETLQGNMITSFKVSLHFIIIGSDSGAVFVLDLLGNLLKRFAHHHGPVNDIAIDSSEEFMSTVGVDGVLVIQSLYTDDNTMFQIKSPLSCVQFEPDYSKRTTKAILYGNELGELTISSKGWFGVTRTVIGSGIGPVLNASWNNDIIIWISRSTTKFYHLKSSTECGTLDNIAETDYELFRPVIAWKNENEAYIGFGDSVTVIGITDTVSPKIEKKHQIKLECICCGLAPFQEYLLVFGYHINADAAESINQPQLYILDNNGNIYSNDELEFENPGAVVLNAKNYQLGYFPSEKYYDNVYYVVSPWNVILAKPRDVKDNVSRILERKEYENAIKIIEDSKDYSKREKRETIALIGLQLVEELILKAEFSKAAEICPKVFKQNVEKWDLAVKKFAEYQKLRILYPVLPISNPTLSKTSYNLALLEFIHFDLDLLLLAVQSWPSSLYSIKKIINAAEEALQKDNKQESRKLQLSLLNLYKLNNDLEMATLFGMKIKHPNQLQVVFDKDLRSFVRNNVSLYFEYSVAEMERALSGGMIQDIIDSPAVMYIVKNVETIPSNIVRESLIYTPRNWFIYLAALFKLSSSYGNEYHDEMVGLYCEYQPEQLLNFLKSSSSYSFEKAYKKCSEEDLLPEMLYLLEKMGAYRQALSLIIERIHDVDMAIDFAKEKRDNSLWDEFLKFSIDKPDFIVGLLKNASSYLNPVRIIEKIPSNLDIPNLQEALVLTMTGHTVQESLMEGCRKIFSLDIWNALGKQAELQQAGRAISMDSEKCQICEESLEASSALLFYCCTHVYHPQCIHVEVTLPQAESYVTPSRFKKVIQRIDRLYNKRIVEFQDASPKLSSRPVLPSGIMCLKCSE